MFYVYAIMSEPYGTLYIGNSEGLRRRLKEHNAGKTKSTRGRGPYKLIYSERVVTREEARQREKKLKTGVGREFLKEIARTMLRP